jgi:DNA-binding NarL/FixJ family response regulator
MGRDGKMILAFVPDLFFSTKIQDTAKHLGHTATVSRTPDDFVRKAQELSPALLIVDLTAESPSLEETLMQLRGGVQASPIPLLAFTTHAAWKQTSPLHPLCDQVVTKEALARDLAALLTKYLGGETR